MCGTPILKHNHKASSTVATVSNAGFMYTTWKPMGSRCCCQSLGGGITTTTRLPATFCITRSHSSQLM